MLSDRKIPSFKKAYSVWPAESIFNNWLTSVFNIALFPHLKDISWTEQCGKHQSSSSQYLHAS